MNSATAPAPLRRDTRRAIVGGVIAGIGARTDIDLVVLRIAFVILAILSGGLVLLAYLVAWAALPAAEPGAVPRVRSEWMPRVGGGNWQVGAGLGLLTLSVLLAFRELGIWWSDAIAWPLVLAAFGAAILWRRSRSPEEAARDEQPAWAAAEPATATEPAGASHAAAEPAPRSRFAELYRGIFGVLLVMGAALLFLMTNDFLGGVRDAAVTAVVVLVAIALVLAPFLWRLGRNLAAERTERVRSQERARVGAHLHDSVLQTLALVQKRADDPREVAALARRQERELREWLSDDGLSAEASFAAAVRAGAEQVEDDHRVAVEVVVVGDCDLDERAEAALGAAREAILNAAKHAGEAGPVQVYAEVSDERIEVFVRDRGPGFEPAAVPADRRGVRESIVGRMERAGGRAEIHAGPDGGTEVALSVDRAAGSAKGGGGR